MQLKGTPASYGRFKVVSLLGEGAQGRVYLAHDPHLDRRVAIKTLNVSSAEREQYLALLTGEARTVSKLQHPNIVTLFDAGEHQGEPYLVFEHVEGKTLQDSLRSRKSFPRLKAVEIAIQILEGIGYAHGRGIVHRDLKPANIMFDDKGMARVMDFGIAVTFAGKKNGNSGFAGTPLYAAPESLVRGEYGPQADLFSVAVILYEMLTGRTVVKGDNMTEIMRKMVGDDYTLPSKWAGEVDEKLDGVIMRALAKRPEDRYADAQAMLKALKDYLSPQTEEVASTAEGRQSTLEFLLRRMKHKSDFPALSEAIRAINRIASSDNESVASLSNVILRDFALTNKLLKIVNTAFYGQFGGVSTVSRAVVIMGFEGVRHLAISLLMLNHLQNKGQASSLQEEIVGSFFSGILARELIESDRPADMEEAFICTMFQNLGKMLATFYFFEETQAVSKLVEQKKMSEAAASSEVLGISYEDLGAGIAEAWNFPKTIIHSMSRIRDDKVPKPKNPADRMRVVANLAGEIRRITTGTAPEDKEKELIALRKRFGESIPLSEAKLTKVVDSSLHEFTKEAKILDINLHSSKIVGQAARWNGSKVETEKNSSAAAPDSNGEMTRSVENADIDKTVVDARSMQEMSSTVTQQGRVGDAKAILTAGIQDITNTLVSDYSLSDLLRMILETMYRALPFSRVLICIRDVKKDCMQGRFGFGEGAEQLAAKFAFNMAYEPDVFHVCLSQARDIYIADSAAESIRARIPEWYRLNVGASAFVIFPIMVDKKIVGMFYGDQMAPGVLRIETAEANLLKTLRNQAVLGFKQKS